MDSKNQAEVHLEPFLIRDIETSRVRRERPKWRLALFLFVGLTSVVLLINSIFLISAVATRGTNNGKGVLYEASCSRTRKANIGIHLLINILSSLLLGASNYCMQCLSAPSRPEVDAAHSKRKFLDIGVPSLHNITSSAFSSRKKMCWWILALSSFPLHLCYNSVVFASITAQTYGVFQFNATTKAAIEDGSYVPKRLVSFQYTSAELYSTAIKERRLEELDPLACINAYSAPFQSDRGNVFLIPEDGAEVREVQFDYPKISRSGNCATEMSTEWIYSQFRGEARSSCFAQDSHVWLPRLQANASDWKPMGTPIAKCLSEPVTQQCKLNFSIHLAVTVIIFNLLKLVTILTSIFALNDNPMLTIGDAASSFLHEPDTATAAMCLVSQKEIHQSKHFWNESQPARTYTGISHRWFTSVKRGKLITCCIALTTGAVVLAALFGWGYASIEGTKDIRSVLRISLGSLDSRTIIQSGTSSEGVSGIFANVSLANSPQVIISLIYFSYNATITSMLLAHEWSDFFIRHKSLRVSASRVGEQRSKYFLQLPYRYAVPLLCVSILLHWLASQSIFVVSVELQNMYGQHSNSGSCFHWATHSLSDGTKVNAAFCGYDFMTCAYSPLGILVSLITACALALSLVVLGRKKLSPMPVVGSCSVAIAASCHTDAGERAPWGKRLKWGVTNAEKERAGYEMGHCGLSSAEVESPVPGRFYA
ncbi:uncharacterized protein K460DRAFT_410979 [Cucurbitaria berberidis CBS 394.84]|uniref:DUF6536 domain-containing protein n=1 Tax=Cucurbitaria berberidis CBS 394.84 TaxID=1168544 RepID=A0A9P4G7C1_9PLEO|nr:uncharacterized protein K460DRAFT_410979 [Cucurbitaria berberidis CBS 394.84]KAF1840388.1 hypothetical protein K460DRAFT_410979 [Cucurbitaria berberidis CBS 394.84]